MFFRFALLTLLFGLLIYWFSVHLTPEDLPQYQKLMAESTHLRTRRALEEEPALQKRQNVQKDIWSQNEMHHFQIQSQGSQLTLWQKKDKIEAEEYLENIFCTTSNALNLKADEGIYSFPSHQFIAESHCKLFQGENQIDGTRIHFDLMEETLTYDNPRGHIASGLFDFSAKTLFWEKEADLLYLIDEVKIQQLDDLTLLAKRGTVFLDQLEPKLIVLEGGVRLISTRFEGKESYAMADQLTYNPLDQTLLFSADKRVLFWQDGFSLSASEVLIRQDQSVVGHGDVHFTFDVEEQNQIDAFFKQYL